MGEDLRVRHNAGNAAALLVHHDRGNGHDKAAVAQLGIDALDGVAHHAGNAVLIEGAVAGVMRVERARENADGIVAAIAMAREFHALGAQ